MDFKKNDLEDFLQTIIDITANSKNEEELKIAVEGELKDFFLKYKIELDPQYEKSVFRGRIDALYGFLIVEYESPSVMNAKRARDHAVDQVKEYIEKLAVEQGVTQESLLGVAFDGENIIYVRWGDKWIISRMYKTDIDTLPQLLESFRGLYREPLTSKALTKNFGFNSEICRKMINTLNINLINFKSERTKVLYNEWFKFYSESCGYDFSKPKKSLVDFVKKVGLKKTETPKAIFCLQTYFSLILTLLASDIVSYRTIAAFEGFLEHLLNCSKKELRQIFKDLPEGGIFENMGVKNFLEGDFFWWFTEEWTEDLEKHVINIIEMLNKYEPPSSPVYSGDVKDILKELYEDLIPHSVRHDMGEFYTPNWIAEFIITNINLEENKRLLDPACGSGTFLIQAIQKIREQFDKSKDETELLETIINNIIGIDLNPVAIITARTNYLLAIADLIPFSKGSLFIPIYLADSIASSKRTTLGPASKETSLGSSYLMRTSVGEFEIPTVFIDSDNRLNFFETLEDCIKNKSNFKIFKERLSDIFPDEDLQSLSNLFERFTKLEAEGKNRIWTRLLANIIAPFTIGKFDYVIGNPPWINWESLPVGYRSNTQDLWKQYYLFSLRSGAEARLGGGKKDISMLFVHRCIDFYLNNQGRLIFLITQSVFQSVKTGDGFRKFQIGVEKFFAVEKVDDIVKLKAFRAQNNAAIIYCKKGQKTQYPLEYNIWEKKPSVKVKLSDNSLIYKNVRKLVKIKKNHAHPSTKKFHSPWLIYPISWKTFPNIISKFSGTSKYFGKAGITTWMNSVFYVKILRKYPDGKVLIENLGDIGKIKVTIRRAKIEPYLLFPLLRGRDVREWEAKHSENIYIIVTNNINRKPIPLKKMQREYPLTLAYLSKFEEKLKTRSGYKKYFQGRGPYYAIYNVAKEIFRPYRIFWSEMGDFGSVVINTINDPFLGEKLPMTNNKNMYIPFLKEEEAYFVVSIINYPDAKKYINAKTLGTSTTTKLISEMKIPQFDIKNKFHEQIVNLAKQINNNDRRTSTQINKLN